ncbi:hypothetical protein Ancab_002833 [Ancistrocladus abbreviatus]
MAESSLSAVPPFFGDQNQTIQQHSSSSSAAVAAGSSSAAPQKKRRSLPGTPNPDAEVIALSPKTLMATNRFICEVCNKGFQREQNLQLHRRGHNLPWKLRQKANKDQPVRKKVYLCPEPTCVHHDPARALGDLTGIKKHYSRKHGEKKFKCEKCSKRYAVQSDWKAHSKTCGTREYRCDCGTLFSRRDSFITHRAFCDALAQESARHPPSLTTVAGTHLFGGGGGGSGGTGIGLALSHSQGTNQIPHHHHHRHAASDILHLGSAQPAGRFDQLLTPSSSLASAYQPPSHQPTLPPAANFYNIGGDSSQAAYSTPNHAQMSQQLGIPDLHGNANNNAASWFNLGFFSNATNNNNNNNLASPSLLFSSQFSNGNNSNNNGGDGNGSGGGNDGDGGGSAASGSLFSASLLGGGGHLFGTSSSPMQHSSPHMSATALLQKAAQMGSTSTNLNPPASSLLRGFGLTSSGGSKSDGQGKLLATSFGNMFGVSEHENDNDSNQLQNLMNSLGGGSSSSPLFGFGGGGSSAFDNAINNNSTNNNKTGSFATSDRLTRDFLGVGEIVRSMSGGCTGGVGIISSSSMDSERNASTTLHATPQSFSGGGGGGNFQ